MNSTLGSVVPLAMFSNHLYPGPCEIFVGRSAFLSDASSPTLTMLPLISRALTEYHRPFFFQTTPYRSIVPSFSQLLAGCPNAHGLSHPLCVRAQTITKRQKLSDASTTLYTAAQPAQSSTNWQRQGETSRVHNLAVLCQLAPPARTLCTLCTGSHTNYHFQMGEAPTRSHFVHFVQWKPHYLSLSNGCCTNQVGGHPTKPRTCASWEVHRAGSQCRTLI